jgi:hypothetical protein
MNPELRQKLADYLETDREFRAVYDYSRKRFDAATHLTAHNWEHAYRDTINAIAIGEAEGADMSTVLSAAVMHDIGFLYGATGRTHGAVGAEKLAEYLKDGTISLPEAKITALEACIRTHKGSMHGEVPETLEAKVVSDADMLEKFGPIGVYQGIRSFTEFNLDATEIIRRLTSRGKLTFFTQTGEQLSVPLRAFDAEFAKALAIAYEPYHEDAK